MKEEALALLKALVEIESVTGTQGELAAARFIAGYFEGMQNAAYSVRVTEVDAARGNAVVMLKGRDGKGKTLLNGHMDTVPFGDLENWTVPPGQATFRDGKIFGRGTTDMKAGLAAMMTALKRHMSEGFVPQGDIVFVATCDEEAYGAGAQSAIDEGLLEGVAQMIIAEPTANQLAVVGKGCLWMELSVSGRTSHSAYPGKGVNAVELAYAIYEQLKQAIGVPENPYTGTATCALTKISGGVKENMIPDRCTAFLDIRSIPEMDNDEIQRILEEIIEKVGKANNCFPNFVQIHLLNDRKPIKIDLEHPLIPLMTDAVADASGGAFRPVPVGVNYFTDASVFGRAQALPTVLFGPGESAMAHQPDEFVFEDKYIHAAEYYYELIKRL